MNYTEGDITLEHNPVYNITTADPMKVADQINSNNDMFMKNMQRQLKDLKRNSLA